jgi:dihydroflavonol-4-reductase
MILVTGATGFLGAEVVKQLTDKNLAVKAIKRVSSKTPAILENNPLVTWVVADINEPESLNDAFENVTQVYHCAAIVSFNAKDKRLIEKVNVEGTANIVDLCLEKNIRLLHVSSVAALGDAKPGELISEKHFWDYQPKASNYAISKYQSEMEVWRGIAEGLNAVIVNPSIIIGKNAGNEGSGALFNLVKNGLKFFTNGVTGFVDVTDVAKCMILLMESDITEERFTINAENISYKSFFEQAAMAFGVGAPTKQAKPWMLKIARYYLKFTAIFTGKQPSLTRETAHSSFNSNYYSNQKIIDTLKFKFKPLNQSIAEVCHALN